MNAAPRKINYRLTYTVLADWRMEAIEKAMAKVRTTVRVLEMIEAEQSIPGWYDVVLEVEETL